LLRARIITGALFGAVLSAALLLGPWPVTTAILGALWLVGAWEWGAFARLDSGARIAYAAGLGVLALVGLLVPVDALPLGLLGAALLWWAGALVLVLTYPRPFGRAFAALAGVVVLVPSWLLLVRLHGQSAFGAPLAFTVLLVVWAADVGAFVFGRSFGRHKLAPAVSPGKTWEGMAGGVLAAGLAAAAAGWAVGLPSLHLGALGVATALVSVLGDLTQSLFKRNVGLKDSGKILPGHGGVLDRIDSLTAAVPVFVAGLYALGLIAHV
jgi:phosphatidate cytidylyltransferase